MILVGICSSTFVGYTDGALYVRVRGGGPRDRAKYIFRTWN